MRLGLSDAEFWRMSPRMFFELLEARASVERRKDARAGVVAAVIANVHRDSSSQPFAPSDFFLSLQEEQAEEDHEAFWDSLVDGPPVEQLGGDRVVDLTE